MCSTIFNSFCADLKNVKETSQQFSSLRTDVERFRFTKQLFEPFFCNNSEVKTYTKCAKQSRLLRDFGTRKLLAQKKWEALELYTKSIAFAPNGSDELIVSYWNRSAVLIKLGFPKEALQDIESALLLQVSSDMKEKLLARKEQCKKLLDSSINQSGTQKENELKENLNLGDNQSAFFDSATDVVCLAENSSLGRHLVTSNDVKPGDVLIIEKPYASILLPTYYYTHCTNCFKRALALIPCPNCRAAMFCSEDCYSASQNEFHRIECSILEVLHNLGATRMEYLALRILIKASKQGSQCREFNNELKEYNNNNKLNIYSSAEHVNIYNLVGNSQLRTVADLFRRSFIACVLVCVLERYSSFFKDASDDCKNSFGTLLLRYLQSLPCNAHEISELRDKELCEIGAGAYATLSLVNHSCEPNVVRHCYGDKIVLRAIQPIAKGKEILDNYGHHYAIHPHEDRQTSLLKQYFFACQCQACVNRWPTYDKIPSESPIFKKDVDQNAYNALSKAFEENLKKVLADIITKEILETLLSYLNYLEENVMKPWKHFNQCQEAIKHCWSSSANHFKP